MRTKSRLSVAITVALLACTATRAQSQFPDELLTAARMALPAEFADSQLATMLENGVSDPESDALAILVSRPTASLILVFIRQAGGAFLVADASAVEDAIFGGLGRPRTDYERYESEILDLQQRDDGFFVLTVRTRAWRMGQRYTAGDGILPRPDGMVLQR